MREGRIYCLNNVAMFAILTLLIFINGVFSSHSDSVSILPETRWAFVSYHKSGHMLSFYLVSSLDKLGGVHIEERNYFPPANVYNPEDLKGNVVHLSEAVLAQNWHESYSNHKTIKHRIIHFLRDPLQMVISAYLYHSQDPTPEGTSWYSTYTYCPCTRLI